MSIYFCQFFWLERKLNLEANLCIKMTYMMGVWPLATYLGSGRPKKITAFFASFVPNF